MATRGYRIGTITVIHAPVIGFGRTPDWHWHDPVPLAS
jgi:hypothetical protein